MAIQRLKVGIIGGGFMGRVHTNAARTAGGDVVAISSSSLASAERAAAEFSIGHAYANSDELLADPKIDVVHICTPNSTHASLALAALLAGKHVICEKPVAKSLRQVQRPELARQQPLPGLALPQQAQPRQRLRPRASARPSLP